MSSTHNFKIKFDLEKYQKIFPKTLPPEDEIINIGKPIEDQYWVRQVPEYLHKSFLELEEKRWVEGAWIYIKGTLLWLPPQYYSFLNWGSVINAESPYPQFRLRKLKEYYFKEDCRQNPNCIGSFIMKSRRDGTTVTCMWDALWEMRKGLHKIGAIGLQSITRDYSYDPCYTSLLSHYRNLPEEIKDIFYPEKPKHVEKELKFISSGADGRSMKAKFFAGENEAMDGKEMVLCFLDEVCKWENSLLQTFGIYKKFILEGVMRKGLFVMFSSPSTKDGASNDEARQLWELSDTNNMQPNGTTKSRIHAFHSDPLDGITGMFDVYGDADPVAVKARIMADRDNAPQSLKLNEIRGYPLNKEEMFNSTENGEQWYNIRGMQEREDYLNSIVFKNEETKEPKYIWGNIEWEGGVFGANPYFRANERNEFDISTGRFCFSELPNFPTKLSSHLYPPPFIGSVIGLDPFHKGVTSRKGSNAGAVGYKFRAIDDVDFMPRPTFIYECRPKIETVWEDMAKAIVFTRSKMQYENTSDEFMRYLKNEGMLAWLLRKEGSKREYGEVARGTSGGKFMSRIYSILDSITDNPIDPNKKCLLENWWHERLLNQMRLLNREDTEKFDLFMGLAQAVWGAVKITNSGKKIGADSLFAEMVNYSLS